MRLLLGETTWSGAPGEIRTPDLLLRRTRCTANQQLSAPYRNCVELVKIQSYNDSTQFGSKHIEPAIGHNSRHSFRNAHGDQTGPSRLSLGGVSQPPGSPIQNQFLG